MITLALERSSFVKQPFKTYFTLFSSAFSLSAFTFGGGFVIIPLMRKKFVEKLGWIQEEEMMDFVAIAQSSPGSIAVNASLLVGYRIAGVSGALATVVGTVLPPLFVISIISWLYDLFRSAPVVSAIFYGMRIGVAAVVADVVVSLTRTLLKEKGNRFLSLGVLAASFIAVYFFQIHVLLVFLLCGIVGLLEMYHHLKKGEDDT